MPTTYGYFRPKKVRATFWRCGNSIENDFPLLGRKALSHSRNTSGTFQNPPFIFPLRKCVSQKSKNHFYTNHSPVIITHQPTSPLARSVDSTASPLCKSRQHSFHFSPRSRQKRLEITHPPFVEWKISSSPKNERSGTCEQT